MVVQHNLTAMNSNRMLNITVRSQAKSTEKLSSGYKINRAADDAAGLSISEKMRKQIRGLTQASRNAQDGISMVQTADGALEEVHAMLQRGNELSVKAANGTLSADDRRYIADEIAQIHKEIDRVKETSKFNETYLFPNAGDAPNVLSAKNGAKAGSEIFLHATYNVEDMTYSIEDYSDASVDGTYLGPASEAGSIGALADKIVNEYIPNAIAQIVAKFPALAPGAPVEVDLIFEDDAPGGTLAYASSNGVTFSITVDTLDFSDADAAGTTDKSEMLESTIAHELMHSVMQNKYIDRMAGEWSDMKWFKEGSAQLSGGGNATGWNYWLTNTIMDDPSYVVPGDSAATETNRKNAIKDKILYGVGSSGETYSAEDRPYGTGYLAVAYIGALAYEHVHGASGAMADANRIASGMNEIFDYLNTNSGDTLADAILAKTGKTMDEILKSVNQKSTTPANNKEALDFIYNMAVAMNKTGAGSVLYGDLSKGGTDIIGNAAIDPSTSLFKIKDIYESSAKLSASGGLNLHVGADATSNNQIHVKLFDISSNVLGIGSVDMTSQDGAREAIDKYAAAIQKVSSIRSYYGAIQNRLEHTINNLDNVVENTTAAESQIRDTDMATEMVRYSNNNILAQAGQAMLAQANQSNQGVLALIG